MVVFCRVFRLTPLDMLTPTERKLYCGYIHHELIVTEENDVNDLKLVTEVRGGWGAGRGAGVPVEAGSHASRMRSSQVCGEPLDRTPPRDAFREKRGSSSRPTGSPVP